MAKFEMTVLVPENSQETARLGSGTRTAGTALVDADKGKLLKLAGASRYDLCAAGDAIEASLTAVETAPLDDYTIGTVQTAGRLKVTCDGLQATPGTGTVAVGDLVVASTPVAAGTALGTLVYPKVAQATSQTPGLFNWRVVHVSVDGSVGDTAIIERV